jgi:hypothetical protein
MAWLAAIPKPPAGSRREKLGLGAKISRADQMKKDKITPQMPPNPMPHIIERLIEIGLTEPAGMGVAPISWQTIAAWSGLTRISLSPWEARLLRHLSVSYLGEFNGAGDETRPSPFRTKVTRREIELERAGLLAVLG